jgi:deoxyhypusine synthase
MASAGLTPLLIWLAERGYVDVQVSTSANATEDLLEARGSPSPQVDPDRPLTCRRRSLYDRAA